MALQPQIAGLSNPVFSAGAIVPSSIPYILIALLKKLLSTLVAVGPDHPAVGNWLAAL